MQKIDGIAIDAAGNLTIPRGTTLPVSGMVEGDLFYKTDSKVLYVYDGTGWVTQSGVDTTAVHKATANEVNGMTTKATPIDADILMGEDSAGAAWTKIKVTWANIKATLKTYFDTLYWGKNAFKPMIIDGGGHAYSQTTYAIAKRIPFLGTTNLGTPTAIKFVANINSDAPYSLKVYDVTNALTVAEVTGQTNTTPAIINFGTIANLSAGESIWEVQIKCDTGGAQSVLIYGGVIE